VDEVLARGRAARLVVRVEDLERGIEVLRDSEIEAMPDGDRILVSLPATQAARVSRTLGEHGLWVSELRPEEISLEEVFLQLTSEVEAS
jgi:hypothetical protein